MKRRLVLYCLAIALSNTVAHAADEALIAAAKKEGVVNWYTAQIVNQFARPAAEAFEKKYGIKVIYVRGDSVELAVRLINEGKANRVIADVFDSTAAQVAVKKEGLVERFIPENARRFPAQYRDANEFWVATNFFVHAPAFNTGLVPKGGEPKSWKDLLDPKWQSKMAWAGHATTSGAPGFIAVVLAEMGEEKGLAYLRELAKQNITPLGGSVRAAVDQVIAGEYTMVLQAMNHQPVISARSGAPVDWAPINPALAVLSVASLVKGAAHPNAGKLFIEFMVSEEGQKLFQAGDYIPVDPAIPPRDARLRPDGDKFRALFVSPEALEVGLPKWLAIFKEIFR